MARITDIKRGDLVVVLKPMYTYEHHHDLAKKVLEELPEYAEIWAAGEFPAVGAVGKVIHTDRHSNVVCVEMGPSEALNCCHFFIIDARGVEIKEPSHVKSIWEN